jgi:hypothetical protein
LITWHTSSANIFWVWPAIFEASTTRSNEDA